MLFQKKEIRIFAKKVCVFWVMKLFLGPPTTGVGVKFSRWKEWIFTLTKGSIIFLRSDQKKIMSVARPVEDVTGMAAVLLVRLSTTRGH